MIRRSFQDFSKTVFIPLYGALVRPHLEYGMPACLPNPVADLNHLDRIQRLATRLATGIRHLPYEERLQRRWLRGDLITAFKIFTDRLDVDPNLFFFPHTRRGLRGHPYKVLQGASHRQRRGLAFSVRVVKYWNKLPASVVTAPSVNVFKTRLEKVWAEVFPHILQWLNAHRPIPTYTPPLTGIISICYPTPCSMYVVSSGPLWPTFYHYKS